MTENSNTPQVELWQDVNRKLDKKRLENSLALSLPKFIEAYGKNMSSKDQEAFNTAVGDILTSIQNGNIGERTIARELVFKDGKERGTENKRMKQAYGLAANFVNSVIDAMPEYIESVKKEEVPIQKTEENVENTSEKIEPQQKQEETKQPTNPLEILQQKLDNKNKLKLQKLANWDVEANSIIMQLPELKYNDDAVIGMYKKMNLGNGYASYFRNKVAPQFFANLNNILSPEKLGNKDMQITNTFGMKVSAKQHIVNTLDFFIKHPDLVPNNGEFNALSSGKITIPGSFNEDTGTILLYNPSNKTLSRESITNEPELFEHYKYKLGLVQPQQQQDNFVPINKNGGVIKFEYGGTTLSTLSGQNYMSDDELNNFINSYQTQVDKMNQARQEKALNAKQQKLQAVQQAAKAKNRSVKTQEKMTTPISKKELSGTDIARMTAAVGDLGAIATSFTGAGIPVSAGLGVASTLTNLGADLVDGDNVWDSLGRAGTNLGLDAIGLIPGAGATGKIAKIGKSLTKMAPWVLGAMATSNLGEEAKAFKKLVTNPSDLNADDLNMIAGGLSLVLGLKTGYKARKIRHQARVADKTGVVTKSGKVAVIDTDELSNLKTNEALNNKIQSIKEFEKEEVEGAFRNESKGWKNLWGYTLNRPKTIEIYDFNKVKEANKNDITWLQHRAHGYLPIRGDKYKYDLHPEVKTSTTSNSNTASTYVPNSPLKSRMAHYQESDKSTIAMRNYATKIRNERLARMRRTNIPGPVKVSPYKKGDYAKAYPTSQYPVGFGFKQGGILKAQQGSKLQYGYNTGIKFGNNTFWYKDVFTPYNQHIIDTLSSTDDNYGNWLNTMQHNHSGLYNSANKSGDWTKTAYLDKDNLVAQYQNDYAGRNDKLIDKYDYNTNGIVNAVKANRYDLYGPRKRTSQDWSSGNWKADNLYSSITDDRRLLGRKGDWDENSQAFKDWQTKLASKNYTMYLDPEDSYYKLKRLNAQETALEQNKGFKLGEGQLPTEKKSVIDSIKEYSESPEGLKLKSDLSEAARAYYLKQQNLKRLKAMNNFQPYHLEHPTYERQTTDMTNVLKSAYDNGAQAMAKNNIPRYADASLNEAIKRETVADVRQNLMQAENQNAEYINQQRDANDKIAMENEQVRIDTANKNKQLDYAANEEKRLNTMKIHEANTDIDNAFWMKQNYDLEQKAQRQIDLQDWWKGQQIGTLAQEEQDLLSNNSKYNQNRDRLITLMSQGKDPSDPEYASIIKENTKIVEEIKKQANENLMNRISQIYGIKRFPFKTNVTYQPEIALNANGGSIKVKIKSGDNEKAKLNARSKDNDRFMKAVNKTVDAFLAQDKQLGKSLLHKLTLKQK